MKKTVTQRYEMLVQNGTLKVDPRQKAVVAALQQLSDRLITWRPFKRRLFRKALSVPKGIYLWGGVGRGKSLLMDLFYNNCPFPQKKRVHFHEFMLEAHERITAWRTMNNTARRKTSFFVREADIDDPMPHVAQSFFNEAALFCFDEVQVTDIADAMVLGRFFDLMLRNGAVIIATSNRPPEHLYKDGINRQLFLPAIDALRHGLDIIELDNGTDYRRDHLIDMGSYFAPLSKENLARLEATWRGMICDACEEVHEHNVQGRTLTLARTARGIARAAFSDICDAHLGSADYLTIARHYHSFFMDEIPLLGPQNRNEAKRFVTFIDTLYEHKTKFICTAAAEPSALYPKGDGAFEFERTASRLIEMQSDAYICLERIPSHEEP